MQRMMSNGWARAALVAALAGTGVVAAPAAGNRVEAQTTTGSVRGYIRDASGAPLTDAQIVARNTQVGSTRNATTNEAGFYNLAGLRPGAYELSVRRIGAQPATRNVVVGIGQTLSLDLQLGTAAATLATVQVTAAPIVETRTSEIATNVTQEQINTLPTPDRNFLSLAVLAPGVQVQNDQLSGQRKTFTAGAQGADQVNVFIDGASYKNDILQGGVAGQDASRGNPFPRNAVQEYRILTQNYKAEYQKASSAIITATTRTGGEKWAGNVFFNTLTRGLVALDTFDLARKGANSSGFSRPDYRRNQMGVSAGGPIATRFRFFGSYEGQQQDRASNVLIVPDTFTALRAVNFAQYNGKFAKPFSSTLTFGKLTFLQNEHSTFDVSFNGRTEKDIRDFEGFTAYTAATNFHNQVNTGLAKHTYVRGNLLSEATASYQQYHYQVDPRNGGPSSLFYGFGCCVRIGSATSSQDFQQRRAAIREDVTYSGVRAGGQHVFKGGTNVDYLNYDVVKRNSEVPTFVFESFHNQFRTPERVEFQTGDPNFKDHNVQVGAYLQDDYTPVERLTLNLGVRWDFESNQLNRDFKTPQNERDSLVKYASRLFIPLDQSRYFTDGTQRSPYYGAIQPRVGASYSLDQQQHTTLFGGWGKYVDRTLFDLTTEERFAQQHPSYLIRFNDPTKPAVPGKANFDPSFLARGKAATDSLARLAQFNTPEIKLLPNDLKPPMSQQFTAGVREVLGSYSVEAAYTGVRSRNTPTFYFANQNFTCPTRSFSTPDCFQQTNVPGFGTILLLDNAGKTWYDALAVKVDRAYRQSRPGFGYGGGIAYTFAKRETEGFNDNFSFPNPVDYPRQARNDERHRVVTNFIVDVPYAFGIQLSGLVTLGSGLRYDVGDRFGCTRTVDTIAATCTVRNFQPGGGQPKGGSFLGLGNIAYRNVDLHLRKDFFKLSRNRVGVTADLYNALNHQNLGGYSSDLAGRPNYGRPTVTISDPRRLQIGAEFDF
jgi:Carboxypeptidase regulatory-like domain/TonB-dependent Receptor Plug Domain/TonB dependent receptor